MRNCSLSKQSPGRPVQGGGWAPALRQPHLSTQAPQPALGLPRGPRDTAVKTQICAIKEAMKGQRGWAGGHTPGQRREAQGTPLQVPSLRCRHWAMRTYQILSPTAPGIRNEGGGGAGRAQGFLEVTQMDSREWLARRGSWCWCLSEACTATPKAGTRTPGAKESGPGPLGAERRCHPSQKHGPVTTAAASTRGTWHKRPHAG